MSSLDPRARLLPFPSKMEWIIVPYMGLHYMHSTIASVTEYQHWYLNTPSSVAVVRRIWVWIRLHYF